MIEKAKEACVKSGHPVADHSAEMRNMVNIGSGVIKSLPQAALGSASLVVHALNTPNLTPPQANSLRNLLHGQSLAVVARKTSTSKGLRGTDVRDEFQGKSKAARRLNLAVQHLLGGEPREAFRIACFDPPTALPDAS